MNKEYAEDSLVRPESLGPIETDEDEVRLLNYLGELADGTRWIYNESNRIVEAATLALNLIRAKNRELAIAGAERSRAAEAARKQAFQDGYNAGYESGMKVGVTRAERKSRKKEAATV